MLIERFLNIDPDKIALSYQGKQWTYGNLLKEITHRQSKLKNHTNRLLLASDSPTENLFNLLTAISLGKQSVIAGKEFSAELLEIYASLHKLEIIKNVHSEDNYETLSILECKNEDLFLGVLSSGSTGESKIIWKDYQSWFNAFPHQSQVFGISNDDTVFVLDALAYSANLNTVLHALWQGCTIVIEKLQNASNWPYIWQKNGVTSLFLVPSHLRLVSERNFVDAQIKSVVTAGEKLSTKLAENIIQKFPGALITEYYGAAELGHISFIQGKDIITQAGSVGRAFPEVTFDIKDDKIWVESPYISPDYRQVKTVHDFGFIDENGFLHLLGREGRMFNRRGLNIFAQEIENAALEHPFVFEAVSTQVNDDIFLFVVGSSEAQVIDLRTYLLKLLPPQKLPNRIIFCQNLPRNSAGKVDFRALLKIPVSEDESAAIHS